MTVTVTVTVTVKVTVKVTVTDTNVCVLASDEWAQHAEVKKKE